MQVGSWGSHQGGPLPLLRHLVTYVLVLLAVPCHAADKLNTTPIRLTLPGRQAFAGAGVGISAGTMHSLSLVRILAWLTPLICSLAFATEPVLPTSAEVRAEQVRQTVLDILSYTRWPTEPAELRLCITAPTEYATALFSIKQQANGRPVSVHRYDVDDEALGRRCDVLYLGILAPERRLSLFQRLQEHPILSISEQSAECVADAVFCLRVGLDRVRFRVNLDALARSGVRVHPAVLKLAKADEETP